MLENKWQSYFRPYQINKKPFAIFNEMEHQEIVLPNPYIYRGKN